MSVADDVLATIAAVTREPAVHADRDVDLFAHQILDSLRAIELLLALSQRFGVSIALSEIDRVAWSTPNRIVSFMEQRIGV